MRAWCDCSYQKLLLYGGKFEENVTIPMCEIVPNRRFEC